MRRFLARGLVAGVAVLSLGACDFLTDLDTENLTDPDLERVLTNPGDVESMIASSWVPFWTYNQGNAANFNVAASVMAHELTTTVGNFSSLELSREPRTWAYNNHPAYGERWLNQAPWYSLYGAITSANDGLRLIDGGMRMREGTGATAVDNTPRARAFAKFTQGILYAHMAKLFDQGPVVTEDDDITDPNALVFKPHTEMQATGIAALTEAAAIASANSFTIPDTWINGLEIPSQELARIAHSYIARSLAYTARTPAERAAVNWNQVITHLDQGIIQDHAPIAETGRINALFRAYTQHAWFWADYRVIGPGDVSGRYQQWINAPPQDRTRFIIESPDARIAGANRTTDVGTYFHYDPAQGVLNPDRGLYNWSFYRVRIRPNTPSLALYLHGPQPLMSMVEMDLLRAEAYIRTNRPADAAALINKTRVANGNLPPVTASGVPAGADCVPRKNSGACGDLMDAMMYEKNIETLGIVAGRAWWDRRGWGTLAPGTMTQLPVPGRELETLLMPMYTFGGSPGEVGSAQ
jgi:hypothetical protein